MIASEKLEMIRQRFAFIEAKLSDGAEASELASLGREYAELKPVVEQIDAYQIYLEAQIDATAMLDDPEMRDLAQEELQDIREKLPKAERAITQAL
ncbi:MAG: PCRF domain-containing protein, partial [Paracoccaceae bacterium]